MVMNLVYLISAAYLPRIENCLEPPVLWKLAFRRVSILDPSEGVLQDRNMNAVKRVRLGGGARAAGQD